MMRLADIYAGYNRVEVLKDINLEVHEREVVCLLGANGAGKSTLLRVVSGILPPHKGRVVFNREEITRKRPDYIVRLGISHVPEGRQIFSSLSVKQNLLLGTYARRARKDDLAKLFSFVFDLFPVLERKIIDKSDTLSGGEQQMLAIARGLMSSPKMLLLDEPSLGLAPLILKRIFEVILHLSSQGISILLVEQNAAFALQIAARAYIMETGKVVIQGEAKQLIGNDELRKRYLGRL